jgi:hypothetical protein
MFNTFRDKDLMNKRESTITRHITNEECEKRILERFSNLNNEKIFHNYFCSYDFHSKENDQLEFWRGVLIFLFESVYQTFSIPIKDILEKTKLKNKRPLGLQNIIIELIGKGEFILSSSLKSDEYFKQNYKNLYGKESWGSWLKNNVIATVKLPLNYISSSSSSSSNKVNGVELKISEGDTLINKKLFHGHMESIINLLSSILMEEDIEVLTKYELKNLLLNSNLRFSDSHLDLCLDYLSKIKKIEIFKVKVENVYMDCIKLLRDEHSTVNEKDRAIINILVGLKNFDRKIEETMTIVQDCLFKAKSHLKTKNREAAANCIKKKNLYLKAYNHYSNLKMTLEQNLIDIKSMESNQNVKNILEDVVKTSQKLKLNVEEFNDVTEKLREHQEDFKEAKNILMEYHDENYNVIIIIFIYF